LIVLSQLCCSHENGQNNVVINVIFPKAQFEKFKDHYLYLYNADQKKLLDSTLVQNEKVIFRLKTDSLFYPFKVDIKYNDTLNNFAYKHLIGFKNPYVDSSFYSMFYVDNSTTTIYPYFSNTDFKTSTINGSKQNELYFKNILLSYPQTNHSNKTSIINKNIEIIKQYPYSFYLLSQLFFYKEKFEVGDLKKMLTFFNTDVKKASTFKSFDQYFLIANSYDEVFPSTISFQNESNAYHQIFKTNSNCFLLVFWASWCTPCRKEIPELKKLYQKYKGKGLEIASISIDNDRNAWNTALDQEKMSWQQFIVTDSTKKWLSTNYNLKTIPKIYLFDKTKNLFEKFIGNDSLIENKILMLLK
jgi:thiol-disulfide isomerase/thioredoxin